jgi:hypothetical protein
MKSTTNTTSPATRNAAQATDTRQRPEQLGGLRATRSEAEANNDRA